MYNLGGARVNNIICEEIIGMFSNLQKRAPNATVLSLSAKIKCTKNKTIDYLMGMDATQRNSTIKTAINISSIVKKRSRIYIKTMHEEIVRRVKAKVMLRQKKKKTQVEKKIRLTMETQGSLICAMDCSPDQSKVIHNIINQQILQQHIIHVWYHKDENIDVVWHGKAIGVQVDKKSGDPLLLMNYWSQEDHENDGEISAINVYQLAADFFCEDLWFI